MYVLTNSNGSYLYRDKESNLIKPTVDINQADLYESYDLAERTLRATPRTLKQFYSPVELEDTEPILPEEPEYESIGIMNYNELELQGDLYEELKDSVSKALESHDNILHIREKAMRNHSIVESKITDLLHYIEFNKLDCYKGYVAYKTLRTLLTERRQVKNVLFATKNLNNVVTQGDLNFANTFINTPKHYCARELKDLFEHGIYQES